MSSEAPVEICRRCPKVMHGMLWRANHKTKYRPLTSWTTVSKPLATIIGSAKLTVAPEDHITLKLDTAEEALALGAISRLFRSHRTGLKPIIGTPMEH